MLEMVVLLEQLVRDRLKILQLGNIGSELNDASKNAYLNLSDREMKSASQIGDLIQKTRTFNGATVPNVGGVAQETLFDDTPTTIRPSVGQSWNVSCMVIDNQDAGNDSTFTLELFDDVSGLSMPIFVGTVSASSKKQWGLLSDATGSFPALNLQLTNSLYLQFSQDLSAAPVVVSASYTMDVI